MSVYFITLGKTHKIFLFPFYSSQKSLKNYAKIKQIWQSDILNDKSKILIGVIILAQLRFSETTLFSHGFSKTTLFLHGFSKTTLFSHGFYKIWSVGLPLLRLNSLLYFQSNLVSYYYFIFHVIRDHLTSMIKLLELTQLLTRTEKYCYTATN